MKSPRTTKYFLIAIIGVLISSILFFHINKIKIEKNKGMYEAAISKSEIKIKKELQKIDLVIASMFFFIENTPNISQDFFQDFTDPFKKELNGIRALGWAPKILDVQKKKFLKKEIKDADFVITEIDSANSLIVSEKKQKYYPISVINPFKELEDVLGYDLYSNPRRRSAIIQATASKKMAFTGPIKLIKDNKNNDAMPGFLAMKAVFNTKNNIERGVVFVAYTMHEFLENTLDDEINMLDFKISDQVDNTTPLYNSLNYKTFTQTPEVKKTLHLNVGNRVWDINFYAKSQFTDFPHIRESYFVLILGLLTTFLLTNSVIVRDNRNAVLEKNVKQRTLQLETSNRQKENLLKEVHHRVMNNLQITSSLMNLQKRKLRNKNAINALTSSQERINAIALIHQKIYQHEGVDAVDLYGYLENLIKIHKKISPLVRYNINCPKVYIDLDTAVPLAIITSEIVVNALKHAFPKDSEANLLEISVNTNENDEIDLSISDNGVGLPDDFNIDESQGLGHEIIKKLCRQLSAEFNFSSTVTGSIFKLHFKQNKSYVKV